MNNVSSCFWMGVCSVRYLKTSQTAALLVLKCIVHNSLFGLGNSQMTIGTFFGVYPQHPLIWSATDFDRHILEAWQSNRFFFNPTKEIYFILFFQNTKLLKWENFIFWHEKQCVGGHIRLIIICFKHSAFIILLQTEACFRNNHFFLPEASSSAFVSPALCVSERAEF